MKNGLFSLSFLILFTCVFFKQEEENYYLIIDSDTTYENNIGIGNNFVLETNLSNPYIIFDEFDIENISFITKLRANEFEYINISCFFWKPLLKNLYLICNPEDDPNILEDKSVKLDVYIMKYKGRKIKIFSSKNLKFNYVSTKYPFLYGDNQTIDINDGSDIYELKFKVGTFCDDYNIFLYDIHNFHKFYIYLDDCKIVQNEMTCKLSKQKIDSFGCVTGGEFETHLRILSFNKEYGLKIFYMADIITITNKYLVKKQDIFVEINKLLENLIESENYIAYETNVTNIRNIESSYFILNFTESDNDNIFRLECILKKNNDNSPLMVLCKPLFNSKDTKLNIFLNEFYNFNVSYVNYNYNFIISNPMYEEITIYNGGDFIKGKYPEILNFISKDNLTFTIYGGSKYTKGLTLDPNSEYLKCDKNENVVQCNIPKTHFKEQKNGYYYLYHKNITNGKSKFYENSPFKVTFYELPKNLNNSSEINYFSLLVAVVIILFFI